MAGNRSVTRVALLGAIALVIAGLAATTAQAQLLKIREVHDSGGGIAADYVELQMYEEGQNLVAGHYLTTYDNAGTALSSYPLPGNVASGENQRTILITDGGAGTPAPDFIDPSLQVPAPAGSACWMEALPASGIDCVSWGPAARPAFNPSPVGMPVLFFGGLPAGGTIRRTIEPYCPTLLEAADDINDSATDFVLVASPDPRNNASPPTETACGGSAPPDTDITEEPKPKTRSKKATFEFTSTIAGSTFECNLDGAGFQPCTTPHHVKVRKGKHSLQVRARNPAGQVDPAPAQADWKVKPKKPK